MDNEKKVLNIFEKYPEIKPSFPLFMILYQIEFI